MHQRPSYRELVESMPDPSTRPAYSDLRVDSEGCVWAAEHHSAAERGSATDWEVFAPEGEWLGSVRLPARFKTFEIGEDYVLGKQLDELDVEHVQLLRLNRN
jgi:sugar lactone lactonase YvrE